MVSSKSYSCTQLLFLSSLCLLFVEIKSIPLDEAAETLQSHSTPEGRQGILEIPKQAATIIRNFIDSSIKSYFNITTPAPLNNVPSELKDSIVGNFLLGNLYATVPSAPVYNPAGPQPEVKPIAISNEPSFAGHAQLVEPTAVSPQSVETSTKKPRVKATPPSPNVIPNQSYGLLVNKSPGDEVYWIDQDATRPSIVIPIQTSTTPRSETITEPELTTEALEITTEDEEEEGIGEEEEAVEAFKKIKY